MKKRLELENHEDLEVVKAVAQAWYSHSGSSRPMSEFDAHRRNLNGGQPSRFKLEAISKSSTNRDTSPASWDFKQSLWDSYELVTVSRRLETGLALDKLFDGDLIGSGRVQRRRKQESNRSLRNLFNQMSSRNETKIPRGNDT